MAGSKSVSGTWGVGFWCSLGRGMKLPQAWEEDRWWRALGRQGDNWRHRNWSRWLFFKSCLLPLASVPWACWQTSSLQLFPFMGQVTHQAAWPSLVFKLVKSNTHKTVSPSWVVLGDTQRYYTSMWGSVFSPGCQRLQASTASPTHIICNLYLFIPFFFIGITTLKPAQNKLQKISAAGFNSSFCRNRIPQRKNIST